jgi:hypothetical protein
MGLFDTLANEQLYHIFSMLDIRHIVRLGITGRGMHEVINNDSLWHILFQQHFGSHKVAMLAGITWAHHCKALGTICDLSQVFSVATNSMAIFLLGSCGC